jgi:hypothetical protein
MLDDVQQMEMDRAAPTDSDNESDASGYSSHSEDTHPLAADPKAYPIPPMKAS